MKILENHLLHPLYAVGVPYYMDPTKGVFQASYNYLRTKNENTFQM